jgi:hypothetical protein
LQIIQLCETGGLDSSEFLSGEFQHQDIFNRTVEQTLAYARRMIAARTRVLASALRCGTPSDAAQCTSAPRTLGYTMDYHGLSLLGSSSRAFKPKPQLPLRKSALTTRKKERAAGEDILLWDRHFRILPRSGTSS